MRTETLYQEDASAVYPPLQQWASAGKLAALLGVAGLTLVMFYAWASGTDLRALGAFGYPGVFLLAFLSSATVLVPVPGLAFTFGAGAVWHPVIVGIVGGLGAASGEFTGYLVGRAGLCALRPGKGNKWRIAESWLRRFGFWAVLLMAILPNPFFDAIGLAAGALAYPARRFWLAAAAGNCVKYLAIAHFGGMIAWPPG